MTTLQIPPKTHRGKVNPKSLGLGITLYFPNSTSPERIFLKVTIPELKGQRVDGEQDQIKWTFNI